MGNKGSKQDGTTKEIDKKIRQDLATDSAVLKLLLLGAGGSGKSTFAKQLTLMFSDGYLSENSTKASFARSIHSNMIQGMQILLAEGQRLGFTVSPDLEVSQ